MNNKTSYEELVQYWFSNPEIWFGCSSDVDIFIKNKYNHLLINTKNEGVLTSLFDNLDNEDIFNLNSIQILARIILFDQISRHIFRLEKEHIKEYDLIAIQYVHLFEPFLNKMKPEERCFILLPYRHTFNKEYVEKVFNYIQQWHYENPEISIYRRFYIATLQSLGKINSKIQSEIEFVPEIEYSNVEVNEVLDPQSTRIESIYRFMNSDDLLEPSPFLHPIYIEFSNKMDQIILPNENKIILSISGGVDSMVCCYLLYLWNLVKDNKYTIECMTINYENRMNQNNEIYMVNKYCNLLGFKHYVRKITEIKRSRDNDRDIYESVTREIRFDMYKNIGGVVVLGHNKDDTLENVFSNIKKKRSYRNLYGMNLRGEEKDVHILRPLLKTWKKDIIQYAKDNLIPFVYDSTPAWSERGKMRDILIPQIQNFDSEIIEGMFYMVDNFKEIYEIYEKMTPHIIYENDHCYFENQEIYFYEYLKKIIYQIMEHYKIKPIKNKSILNMSEELKRKNSNRITLSKELIVQLKENYLFFFILKS